MIISGGGIAPSLVSVNNKMERRMTGNCRVRCGAGEKVEITSKPYLLLYQHIVLIGILREFDRMSTLVLLTWMARFGVIFKEPLREVVEMYDSGAEEAVDRLNEQISFEPFNQLIERLKLSLVRISIKDAFEDIDVEKEFYLEQRQDSNKRSIESKQILANMLAGAPMAVLSMFYLVVPMIYYSIVETNKLMNYIT